MEHDDVVLGECDWCHQQNVPIEQHRDPEEGSAGAMYDLCQRCYKSDGYLVIDWVSRRDCPLKK